LVKYWDEQIKKGIALTKSRIKHLETHGDGDTATKEKKILVKQLRTKEIRGIK